MSTIRGTVSELLDKKISINGVELNQNSMSVLTRLGFFRHAGMHMSKTGKNRSSSIWEIETSPTIQLTVESKQTE